MRHIKALLFDKDGTLVDFEATWGPTYQTAARAMFGDDTALIGRILTKGGLTRNGRFAANSLLAAGSYRDIAEDWKAYTDGHTTESALALLTPHFENGAVNNAAPITDLSALFKRLKSLGYTLGIATNDTEASARRTAGRLIDAGDIDFIVGCDSGYGGKPEPGMFQAFAGAVGMAPENIAMIGDNMHDLEMGRRGNAGALIGVLSGASTREQLQPPADHVIDSVAALPDLLVQHR